MMDTYLDNSRKASCTGCSACVQVCGKGAMHMEYDAEGFAYPVIDREKCVNCGLWQGVPVNTTFLPSESNLLQSAYAVPIRLWSYFDLRSISRSERSVIYLCSVVSFSV